MLKNNEQALDDNNTQNLQTSMLINGLSLASIDHKNLRGLLLKGRPSPIRQKIFNSIKTLFVDYKFQKIHPQVLDSELFGGLDFSRTFATGRPIHTNGYLNHHKSIILLSMAERLEASLVCKYSTALDLNNGLSFIVSDESTDEETIGEALKDRLAFSISIENLHYSQTKNILFDLAKIKSARKALASIPIDNHVIKTLTEICVRLGIKSLRAPILASYAARASAAFSNKPEIMEEDIVRSIKLVLSHRATILPDEPGSAEDASDQQQTNLSEDNETKPSEDGLEPTIPAEML